MIALYRNACPTKSARQSTARRGYLLNATRAISRKGIDFRWRTVIVSSGTGSFSCVSCSIACSIESTMRSASSSRPWMNSQRGLSGTLRRTTMIVRPSTAPQPKASRQPRSFAKRSVFRNSSAATEPSAEPIQ